MDHKDSKVAPSEEMVKLRHRMIYDITSRLESFSLNTVVSGFMEYNNKMMELSKRVGGIDKETLETAVILLAPFIPHVSEELWSELGHTTSVFVNTWPVHDEEKMKDSEIEIAVQINGKTKVTVMVPADADKEAILEASKAAAADKLTGTIVKEIYVPGKIVNIVMK
jgi:leucyl-tRNA synthetase